jgi:serine/threonine-protein kinase HipA
MSIKTVNVFLNQNSKKIAVGKLAYKDGVIYFEYESEFISSGTELSPYKLPLMSGLSICDDKVFEGLFGLFGDSLPDGWGRLLLDRHFLKQGINYSDITPLDRLSYIGKYGTGALSYEPVIDDIQSSCNDKLQLDNLSLASMKILQGSSEDMIEDFLALGGSSAGARPKVMVQLSDNKKEIIHGAQVLKDGFSHWMVKFASSTDTIDIGKLESHLQIPTKVANLII